MAYDLIQATTQPNPNYLINSGFQVAQAATSATITAGTARPTASIGYPVVDSWFCYSVGGNPTLAQIAGSGNTANRLQLTGAASITSVGIGQRIEAINTTSLANKTVTLSFECSNSLLTSLTVIANRPTTTANTFGTIATPTKTLINSTNVAINSTLTRYSVTFTCPQDVNKGLEILFVLGAQTSGTFVLSNVKLEEGSVATTYITPDFASELVRCKRYFQWASVNAAAFASVALETIEIWVPFSTKMAFVPIVVWVAPDSETSSAIFNVSSAALTRATSEGVGWFMQAAVGGQGYYLVGYRIPCSAHLP
jgi:hypothetical protein